MHTNIPKNLQETGDIAIIGISVRAPDANDYNELWENLCAGKESIRIFTDEELDKFGVPQEKREHPNYIPARAILKDIESFDAPFFGYSPREATKLDPQQRFFLECAWDALEDGGYANIEKPQNVGIFAGSGGVLGTYMMAYCQSHPEIMGTTISSELFSLDRDYGPTRAAFKLNLEGPAVNVQCACSTSLVATHLACKSILEGSCEMALAGGVSMGPYNFSGYIYESGGAQSVDGHIRAFDAEASGTVFGMGIGVVLLKKLSSALQDEDHIYAVIKGTAINNDAHMKDNFASPAMEGQSKCIETALMHAKVDPATITYVLAHGTATLVGDPIEFQSLSEAFRKSTSLKQYCALGAIKPNLSHLDAAAGIMNLIVAALCLYHRKIPPLINFKTANPAIDFANSPFYITTQLKELPKVEDIPLRVLTTAFGVGGTNACAVLEEAPQKASKEVFGDEMTGWTAPRLLPISAKTHTALEKKLDQLQAYLKANPSSQLSDIAFTLSLGRSHFAERVAIIANSTAEALKKIESREVIRESKAKKAPKIAFIFSGLGAQHPQMARVLYQTDPTFKEWIDRCALIVSKLLDRPLLSILFEGDEKTLAEVKYAEPALFAVEYSLFKLFESWGIKPDFVLGDILGEYVAATVAKVMSLEDGLQIVCKRAELVQNLPAQEPLDSILPAFKAIANRFIYHTPRYPIVLNVSGKINEEQDISAEYWISQMHGPARFYESLQVLQNEGCNILLEIGPDCMLLNFAIEVFSADSGVAIIPTLKKFKNDWMQLLSALGRLYCSGVDVDWKKFNALIGGNIIPLPTYPFDKEPYWVEPPSEKSFHPWSPSPHIPKLHPLLGNMWKNPLNIIAFANEVDLKQVDMHYLKDHCILGHILFPAAGFVEMIAECARQILHLDRFSLFDIEIKSPLVLTLDESRAISAIVEKEEHNYKVSISSEMNASNWQLHAVGYFTSLKNIKGEHHESIPKNLMQSDHAKTSDLYHEFQNDGFEYGPTFRSIQNYIYENEVLKGYIRLPTQKTGEIIHPSIFDGCLQLLIHGVDLASPGWRKPDVNITLPVYIESLNLYKPLPDEIIFTIKKLYLATENLFKADIDIFSLSNELLAQVKDAAFLNAPKTTVLKNLAQQKNEDILYAEKWEEEPLSLSSDSKEKITFLLFACSFQDPFYQEFFSELTKSGAAYILAEAGEKYQKIDAAHYQIPLSSADSYNQLWRDLEGTPWQKIVIFYPLNLKPTEELSENSIKETIEGHIQPLFHLLYSILNNFAANPPPVFTVARGLWNPYPNSSYADTPIIGMYRGLVQEYLQFALTLMDVDPTTPLTKGIPLIISEISNTSEEREICFQSSKRYVNRIIRYAEWMKDHSILTIPSTSYYRLSKGSQESNLDHLDFKEFSKPPLGDDEVEISIRAVGLNFRDLLNALNLYPGDAGLIGCDCAGKVVMTGKNVANCKPGDFVLGFAHGSLGDYATTPASLITLKPREMSFPEAAAIPIIFLTAYHAFVELAKLQRGEKVLIHAGAGGVGLAAIQVAHHIGAEVFATCSTEQKREYLQHLGVTHIYDSRSLNFAEEILKDTERMGVNVVLNSLSGKGFIDASLYACARGARFLEIGKRNIWTDEEMQGKRPDIQYFIIALDDMMKKDPDHIQKLLIEVMEHFSKGDYHPIRHTSFPLTKVKEALLYLQKAQQIGKVVIQTPPKWQKHIKENRSYLITGGLGGLGLVMAEWLIQKGAKHIVLVGRKAPSAETQEKLTNWMNAGVEIRVVNIDISKEAEVKALFDDLMQSNSPLLSGIMHAAGVGILGLLLETNWRDYREVFAPKIWGSIYLQNQIINHALDLDFFVHFSSASSVTGIPGQTSYCGANSFLDAYSRFQFQEGTPVICLNWPVWNEVGMGLPYLEKAILAGFTPIVPSIALPLLDYAIDQQFLNITPTILDWNTYLEIFPSIGPRSSKLTQRTPIKTEKQKTHENLLEILADAPSENWASLIQSNLQEIIRTVIGGAKSTVIDPKATYVELGLDSLARNEFVAKLEKSLAFKKRINITLLGTYSTIESLAGYLASELAVLVTAPQVKL